MPQLNAMDKMYGMYWVFERTTEVQDTHHFSDIRGFSVNAKSMVLSKCYKLRGSFKSRGPQIFQISRRHLKILGVKNGT
jgi:hypothetical protein